MIAKDSICREIITQAICGKGTKYTTETFSLKPENPPTTIGGCWVMNHHCKGTLIENIVEIHGRFDLNLWYSYHDNSETTVAKDSVAYTVEVPLDEMDPKGTFEETSVEVRMLQDPNCLDAVLNEESGEVVVTIEMGHQAELIGRTKLWVMVCDPTPKKESFSDFSESYLEEESVEESSSTAR